MPDLHVDTGLFLRLFRLVKTIVCVFLFLLHKKLVILTTMFGLYVKFYSSKLLFFFSFLVQDYLISTLKTRRISSSPPILN